MHSLGLYAFEVFHDAFVYKAQSLQASVKLIRCRQKAFHNEGKVNTSIVLCTYDVRSIDLIVFLYGVTDMIVTLAMLSKLLVEAVRYVTYLTF